MSEFINLGDIAEVKNGYAFKSKNFTNTGIPVIKIKNITPPEISLKDVQYVSKEIYEENKKYEINYNDILISMTGSGINQMSSAVGKVGRVRYKEKSLQNQRVGKVVIKDESKYNTDFLYYYLSMNEILEYLVMNSTGSANQANISKKTIENIKVPNVTLSEQKKVVNILSSFDDKIENNNAIIANLEEQAQAIFKSWFIDFEPFQDGKFKKSELGLIPLNWNYNILGEVCKCVLGGTPSRKNERYWGGDIGWINSGEVNRDRIIEPTEFITQEGLNNSATKLLPEKTTLIAITGATLGQVSLLEIDCCTNQSIVGIIENSEVPFEYIYPFIKTEIKSIISNQTGAAQQHINLTDVRNTKILLPESNVLKAYQKIVSPMYKMITNLYFENKKLEKMRDTLLPKLISGEIRVEEAIEVE